MQSDTSWTCHHDDRALCQPMSHQGFIPDNACTHGQVNAAFDYVDAFV
jgi:hypothetical protein